MSRSPTISGSTRTPGRRSTVTTGRRSWRASPRSPKEARLERILIGLPLELSGDAGPAAERATAFAQQVADATGLDVELVDERLTTVEAAAQLRASGVSSREAKGRIDGVAAVVLLEAWLEGQRTVDLDED